VRASNPSLINVGGSKIHLVIKDTLCLGKSNGGVGFRTLILSIRSY